MPDPTVSIFFEKDTRGGTQVKPIEAIPVTIWKCGECKTNLLTTGGRDRGKGVKYANVQNGQVRCSYCGTLNTLQPVAWSGEKRLG